MTTTNHRSFKVGDSIWNSTFPFVVGVVQSIGKVGGWPAYLVQRADNATLGVVFVDEAREAA